MIKCLLGRWCTYFHPHVGHLRAGKHFCGDDECYYVILLTSSLSPGHFSGKAQKYRREIFIIQDGTDTLARFLLTWNTDQETPAGNNRSSRAYEYGNPLRGHTSYLKKVGCTISIIPYTRHTPHYHISKLQSIPCRLMNSKILVLLRSTDHDQSSQL